MKRYKNQKGAVRLTDSLAFRVRAEHRQAVERFAEEHKVGVCDAARALLGIGIERSQAEGC